MVNYYYNQKQQGIAAVQTLLINDTIDTGVEAAPLLKRVTYITEAINVCNDAVSILGSITVDNTTTAAAIGNNKTYQLPDPYYYELKLFTDSTQTVTGVVLKTTDGTIPNKLILGITDIEHMFLRGSIVPNGGTYFLKAAYVFLIDLFEDGNELVSSENIKYQKYKLATVGELPDGTLKLFMPVQDVIVYSLDRRCHFSKGYSDHLIELNALQDNKFILDIRL